MTTVNKSFASTPHRAVKSVSVSPSPKAIPRNKATVVKVNRPAPLTQGCASCGKKR